MDGQLDSNQSPANLVTTLRRLALPRVAKVAKERCEFCNAEIERNHRHLLKLADRNIICACDPCALRFQDTVGGRFKLIPRDARALPDFEMTDIEWESLSLPINLAYFQHHSVSGKTVAMYPSPAGATESLLSLASWAGLAERNPELAAMAPDTEALLVNRIGQAREYFIAPIDVCYELVGLIRKHWRGLSGGDEVWAQIEKFFARLRHQCGMSDKTKEAAHA